jgi:hypothetical protein
MWQELLKETSMVALSKLLKKSIKVLVMLVEEANKNT